MDTSATIRFSGLPNNAQLELAEALKIRSETAVTIGLQLETGVRLLGNFLPSNSLWDVLLELCPDETELDNHPVIIYMRQEVYGLQSLQSTTLRLLGLTNGKAMLRLIHRYVCYNCIMSEKGWLLNFSLYIAAIVRCTPLCRTISNCN